MNDKYKLAFRSDVRGGDFCAIVDAIDKSPKPIVYIELGVQHCGTFKRILEKYHEKDIYCIGVDLFEDFIPNQNNTHRRKQATGNAGSYKVLTNFFKNKYSNFELHKSTTLSFIKNLSVIDNAVVFIDANHTYKATLDDFEAIYPKIKNGYFVFHNASNNSGIDKIYHKEDGGPYQVVKDVLEKYDDLTYIETNRRSAVIQKLTQGEENA